MHRVFVEFIPPTGEVLRIEGDEAHHALRVKRVRPGATIGLLDGAGTNALAEVTGVGSGRRSAGLEVRIIAVDHRPPIKPAVHVLAPAPKGSALEHMIDQLSQVGAASWTPLRTDHSEREPRAFDRLRRIAIESAKQCGRAHLLEIGEAVGLGDALARTGRVIVADAAGAAFGRVDAEEVHLLVGPEGGWSNDERARIAASRAALMRFGPLVMRIETAATVASAAILL